MGLRPRRRSRSRWARTLSRDLTGRDARIENCRLHVTYRTSLFDETSAGPLRAARCASPSDTRRAANRFDQCVRDNASDVNEKAVAARAQQPDIAVYGIGLFALSDSSQAKDGRP